MPNYDDLMGLDMYDLDGFITPSMIKDSLIAAAAGAGAILLASWATPKVPVPATVDEKNAHRLRAGVALVGGLAAGRLVWDYNRDAAMAIIGGVAGLGLIQLLDSFFDMSFINNPLGALPEDVSLSGDEALLSAYDRSQAMAGLESAGISRSAGAFSDPTGTQEALMGFDGAMVQHETLGYQPYLS